MEKQDAVIIFGAGELGKVAQDIVESNGMVVFGFLDDKKENHGKEINSVTVLGDTDDDGYLKFIGNKCDALVAVDEPKFRAALTKMLHEKRKVQPVNAIHKDALISEKATVGYGNLINMGVRVAANAQIGSHCILHTGAIVDFSTVLADFVQIGAGAVVNSGVTIGEGAFIGSGAVLVSGITIGKNARIGAGSVVIADVKSGQIVFGNPAQPVKA